MNKIINNNTIVDKYGNLYDVIKEYNAYDKYDVYCRRCKHVLVGILKYNLAKRECYICKKIKNTLKQFDKLNNRIKKYDSYSEIVACGKKNTQYFKYHCKRCDTYFYQKWRGISKLNCPNCSKYAKKNIYQAHQILTSNWKYYRILNKQEYTTTSSSINIQCTKCGYIHKSSIHSASLAGCKRCMGNYKRTLAERKKDVQLKSKGFVDIIQLDNGIGTYVCSEGHSFKALVNAFLMGSGGCPICFSSKGELRIYQYLMSKNIHFKRQVRFDSCKDKIALPFDFYVNDTFLVEYDGIQHYHPVPLFNSKDPFELRKIHDNIKTKWAKNHNIPLLRIPYTKYEEVEKILDNYLSTIVDKT